MDKQLAQYIRHHIVFIAVLVIVGFTLLAVGEYYLYRQRDGIRRQMGKMSVSLEF